MKFRDLTIRSLHKDLHMITACDTSSGLGEKPGDAFCVSTRIVASFCARVVFFELLAYGIEPEVVVNMVAGRYDETGHDALLGLQDEMERAGLTNVEINGSTEENMDTVMTSINMVGIGFTHGPIRLPRIESGDLAYYLGTPYVGAEVLNNLATLVTYRELRALKCREEVLDVLPVGSKGIFYEAEAMAASSKLCFKSNSEHVNSGRLYDSAGPATVLVVAVKREKKVTFENEWANAKLIGFFS